jgi:hypothetical protein
VTDKDPTIKKTLNDRQIAERKNTLALLSIEKLKVERSIDAKKAELKPLTDSLNLLDEQIHTVATEIDERAAWIPRQLALGEDPLAEPEPGASKPPRSGKKKRASKRTANGHGVDTVDADEMADVTAE